MWPERNKHVLANWTEMMYMGSGFHTFMKELYGFQMIGSGLFKISFAWVRLSFCFLAYFRLSLTAAITPREKNHT